MRCMVVVPADPDDVIPAGTAVLATGRGTFKAYADPGVCFGERCAQALLRGHTVQAAAATEIGWFDDFEGEVVLNRRGAAVLTQWLGRPVYRNDLQARDNRADRRHRARQLAIQGRLDEAYRLDRRLGF